MKRRAISLVEVMVALAVLALAVLPMFMVATSSREEASDAVAFLSLLDWLDEALASDQASVRGAHDLEVTVQDGPCALTQVVRTSDPCASFAPRISPGGPR